MGKVENASGSECYTRSLEPIIFPESLGLCTDDRWSARVAAQAFAGSYLGSARRGHARYDRLRF
jgi:hypothetical protein